MSETSETDIDHYRLSDEENEEIFQTLIVPDELSHGSKRDHPLLVFVCAQPGAGKTKTINAVQRAFERHGGAVSIDTDSLKPYHPQYTRLLQQDDRTAALLVSADGRRWMRRAYEHLRQSRINVLAEESWQDPPYIREVTSPFRDNGYTIGMAFLAVPEALSRLGVVHRFHEQRVGQGSGRLTPRHKHDKGYAGVLKVAEMVDEEPLADAVRVYRRGGAILYDNRRTRSGAWEHPAGSWQAVARERGRQWNTATTTAFISEVMRLSKGLGPEWHGEFAEIIQLAKPLLSPECPMTESLKVGDEAIIDLLAVSMGTPGPDNGEHGSEENLDPEERRRRALHLTSGR